MKFQPTLLLAIALCGLSASSGAVAWMGNAKMYQSGQEFPRRGGFVEPWQPITITCETWPIEPGQRVVAVVNTAGWQSAQEYEFTWDSNVGNNSRWYLTLPTFAEGTQVNFYLKATRTGQANPVYDNNNSGNYGFHQRYASNYRRGPILQWFETDYKTIMKRLPEVVEAGYSAIYLPGPTKCGGGGFSAGYNPVDRFDLGDRLQEGTVRTRFGTTQELQELIRTAKRLGLEVYADMVLNHNDNRASHAIDRYPDMIPEDFHIASSTNTSNNEINFNTESAFSFGMLNHDLVGLADIAQEDGNNTQSGPFNLPPYATMNVWGKPSFVRNPKTPQYYLDGNPKAEDVREYLERWSKWMTGVIGFDGFRLDAVKHVPPGYFGWAPDQAAAQGFSNGDLLSRLFQYNPNLFIFGEVYSSNSYELREYAKTGMQLLDFPLKFAMGDLFNSNGFGNVAAKIANGYGVDAATGLAFQQGGLTPDASVSFVQSHDDGPPTSTNLAHAFLLARPGRPKVYYDGNNVQPGNYANFPRPGRADALGNNDADLIKLTDAASRFGRGYTVNRWLGTNSYAFERQVNNKAVMLFAMNNRGNAGSETLNLITSFTSGTVLKDYSGQRPNVTVGANGAVTIDVPNNYSATESNNGKGYVLYAPVTAEAISGVEPVQFLVQDRERATTKNGFVPISPQTYTTPSGTYSSGRSFKAATLTVPAARLEVKVNSVGASALVRFDQGVALPGKTLNQNTPEGLTDGFIPMTKTSNGNFYLDGLDFSGLDDGLHVAKVRVFSDTGSNPGAYADFNAFFYLKKGIASGWKVDGDLTDFSGPIASQSRNPSSNFNRVDGLYVTNDDKFLYLGLAGRVDANEQLTNGVSLFLDVDGANGLREVSQLDDDSGPATRLLSNTGITLPSGFGADFALASFRNSSCHSAPEAPFAGGLITPPVVGAQAGFYRINTSRLNWLEPQRAAIATQVRINKTDPAKGVEVAVPLTTLFPSGMGQSTGINFVAILGNTGENGGYLLSSDPLRSTLGGRSNPTSWISNQVLPSQPNILSDPGTNPFTVLASVRYNFQMATVRSGVNFAPNSISYNSTTQRYSQTVTITNNSGQTIVQPAYLRVQVPSGVTLSNQTAPSVVVPGGVIQLPGRGIANGGSIVLNLEYQAPSQSAIQPVFQLVQGKGLL